MANQTLLLDLLHQICLSALQNGIIQHWAKEMDKFSDFSVYLHNQMSYGKLDGTTAFGALNRPIYSLKGCSNSEGRGLQMVRFEIAKFSTFLLIYRGPMVIWKN